MEENDTESDSDSEYHLVFTALDELKLASWKSFFKQHSLQDDTLSFMESEDELRNFLTKELKPGLKFGDAFKFSRLWFNKYYVKAEALNIPSQSNGNDRQQVLTQEETHQSAEKEKRHGISIGLPKVKVSDSDSIQSPSHEERQADAAVTSYRDNDKTSDAPFYVPEDTSRNEGLDGPKRKEISPADLRREMATEGELHCLVNKNCEDNQREDGTEHLAICKKQLELQSTRGFSSSQSENLLRTLPGSSEDHAIHLGEWASMDDGNKTHDQGTCAGENKSGLTDQLQGETMGQREPSCLVNDVSQDENHGGSYGTENSTISREQAAIDYDVNFPDPLSSARNASTPHSRLGKKNGTEIEDRDISGRTPTESDTSTTFKSPSATGENSVGNELEENKTDLRNDDSTATKQLDNSIDSSSTDEILNERELVQTSTDEVHYNSSVLQTSSKPEGDNMTVQGDGHLCQENPSEEKLCVIDAQEPREDRESVLRCTPRPFGRKGRETQYRRGRVLDIEENREAEFKSLVGATTSSLPWKIMEKAKKFICACLNADKRGIIYFGVGDCQEQESKYKRGEVLGLEIEEVMDDIVKAFQSVLDDHLKSDAGPLQKGGEQNCVNLEFVPVESRGIRAGLYVIEIEVVRDWKFCKNNIYYSKRWTDKRSAKCEKSPVSKKALSDFYKVHKDEFDDVAIRTNGSSTSVKQHEVIKQVKEPLQAKYKEWKREAKLGTNDGISADELSLDDADIKKYSKVVTERLRGFNFKDFGYILIANKLPPQYRGTPQLSFLQNIPWVAVFDLFDPSSKKDGLHYVCNETSDAPRAKIRTLDDFKEVSSDWISGKDSPLPTRGTTWILKNGDIQKEDWIKNSKDCLYRALSAYKQCIPAGMMLCLFLGLGENAVQEMADIIECSFSILGNSATSCVTIITESKAVGEGFLKASKLSLQKELSHCSITGVPWALLKEIVREMVGPTKFEERGATTDLPYFTGKFKEVLNKVIHSWDDLEVYSPNPRLPTFTQEIEKERDAFYKGAHASQTNLFHNHSIQRTMEKEISSKVEVALKFLSKPSSDLNVYVKTVTVLYEPGSGATTLCRRILWNKRSDYRCAVVKAITSATDFQIEQLQGIIYDEKNVKYSPPALVLVDNFPEIDTRHLTERVTKRQTKCVILSTFAIAKSSTNFDFDITPLRQLDKNETTLVKNILINITRDNERRREVEEVLEREKRFIWFGLELFGREYVKIEERLRNHIKSTLAYFEDSQEIHEMVLHFCCFLHYYSDGRAILPHPVVSDFLYESSEANKQECAFMEHIHKIFGGLLLEGFNETNGYYGWRPAHSLVSEVVTSRINITDTAILLFEKVHKGKAYANKFLKQQVFKLFLDRKRISEPVFLEDPGTDDDDSIDSDLENEILGFYEVRTRYSPLIVDILKGENGNQEALKILITICEKAIQTEDNAYAWQQLARFMGYEMRDKEMNIMEALHKRLHNTINLVKGEDPRIPMPGTGIEAAHIAVDIAIKHQPNYSHHYVTKGVLYHLQLRDFMSDEHPSLLSSMSEVIDICRKAQEVYDKALSTTHALNHYSMIGKIQAIVSLLTIVKGLPCFRQEGETFTMYLKNGEIPYDMRDAISTEEHKYVQSLSATTLDLLNQLFRDVKLRHMTTYNESQIRGLTNAKIRASKLRRAFYKVSGFDKSELSESELRIPLSPLRKETLAVYQQIVQDILFKHDETPYSTWSNLSEGDVSMIYKYLQVLCRRGYGSHDDMLICSKACLRLKDRPPVEELGEIVQKWVEKYPNSEWANLFNYMLHFPIPNRSLTTDIHRTKMSIKKCDKVVREKTTWGYRKSGAEYFLGKGIGLYAIVTSQEFRWLETTWETKTDFWRSREISEKLERVCGQKDVNFPGVITYQGIQLRFDNTRYPNQSKDDLWFYIGFSVAGPYAYDPVDNDSFAIMKRKTVENARPSAVISNTGEQSDTFAGGLSRGRPRDKTAKVPSEEHSDAATNFEVLSSDFPDLPQSAHAQTQKRISSSVPHSLHNLPGVSDALKVSQKSSSSARLSPSECSLHWLVRTDNGLRHEAAGTDQPTYASALQHGSTCTKEERTAKSPANPPTGERFSTRGNNWKSVQGSRDNQTRIFQPRYVDDKGRLHHGTPVRGAEKSTECKIHTGPSHELRVTSRCRFAHAWRGDTVQTVCTKCTGLNKPFCEERRTHVAYTWCLGPYYTEDGKIWKKP